MPQIRNSADSLTHSLFLFLRITVDGFSKTNVGPMILEETFMDKTLKKTYHPLDRDGMSVLAVEN